MQFTIRHPDGRTERRQHIPYTVRQTGASEWVAYKKCGLILARGYISESALRASCDTCTEPAER